MVQWSPKESDKQMGTLTLEQFEQQLKALLREAEDSGLDIDEVCELAEHILSTSWDISQATS